MSFMQTFTNIAKALGLASVLALSAAAGASAQFIGGDLTLDLDQDDDARFFAGDVTLTGRVGGDLEGLAGDVSIDADIGGDVSLAAGDISLAGSVGGDASLAGADLEIGADIGGDLDAAGADIIVSGSVGGDLAAAGAYVEITESVSVSGDVEIAARDLIFLGAVAGEMEARGREVTIAGVVAGDLQVRGETLTFEPGAMIGGDLEIYAPTRPEIPEGVQVNGEVTFTETEYTGRAGDDFDPVEFDFGVGPPGWAIGGALAVSAFVLGALAALVAPKSVGHIAGAFRRRPWISGVLGLVVFAFLPVAVLFLFVLLLITVIGIPLAFILLFALPVVLFLGFAFGGVAIGDMIFNRSGERAGLGLRLLSFFIVLAAIGAVSAAPIVGWFVVPIVLCIGLGAWTLAIFDKPRPAAAPAAEV